MAKVPPAGRAMVRFIARTLKGAKAAPFPGFIEPCKPTLKPKLPVGDKWQFEIKLDGHRTQLHLRRGNATVFTSSGLDWTDKFAPVADAAKQIAASHAVIDGEIIVQNEKGIPDFGALRAAIDREPDRLLFYAFDLLHLDGFDLRGAALSDRRRVLAMLLGKQPGRISMSETIDGPGDILLQHACEMGLEGIVAKRADAPYRSGRVETWIKVKCMKAVTLAVIGYVPAKSNSITALRLARREGGQLIYAGKVGTGFSVRTAQSVRERLEPFMRETPAVTHPLKRPDTTWVTLTLSRSYGRNQKCTSAGSKVAVSGTCDSGY
jgi:bifunctional non-homologous end joining protein LigD